MKTITLEDVKDLRCKFDEFLETKALEQNMFPIILPIDLKFNNTLEHYEKINDVDDQREARAMFRLILKIMDEDDSEYQEAQNDTSN